MKSWPRSSRGPGAAIAPVELMQFCAVRLPYFAVPRFVDFVADLPRTENGKVRKYELRERGVTASTWDREASGYQLKRGSQIMPSYLTLKISPPSIGSGPAWARRSAVEPEEMRHG